MANALIWNCKKFAMQIILKSTRKWVSYGLFTYFLKHIILQVNWELIFQTRVMTLVLKFRKRLLRLLLNGHFDISIRFRSRVMNLFLAIFWEIAKNSHFCMFFDSFSAMDKNAFTLWASYFWCLLFRLFAMSVAKGNDIHEQD
jgi:hypothetical protein